MSVALPPLQCIDTTGCLPFMAPTMHVMLVAIDWHAQRHEGAMVQDTDNGDTAIGLAEEWLRAQSNHDHAKDMALTVAKAHFDNAEQALQNDDIAGALETLMASKQTLLEHDVNVQLTGVFVSFVQ